MNRFGILDQLRDNWPRQFEQPRISLLESKTREFSLKELAEAVDTVLVECQYAPTVKDMVAACKKARSALRRGAEIKDSYSNYSPGDLVHGEKTLTANEALSEYKRIESDFPEAFSTRHSDDIFVTINRIYVKALERAISRGGLKIEETVKEEVVF